MYSKRHFRRGTKARLGQQRQWPVSGSTYTYGNLVNFKGCFHIIHTERLNSCFLGWFLKNDKTLICPQTHSLCFPTHKSKNVEHHLLTFVKYWRVHQSSKFEVQVRSTNVPPIFKRTLSFEKWVDHKTKFYLETLLYYFTCIFLQYWSNF